jgi:hypothetical protein
MMFIECAVICRSETTPRRNLYRPHRSRLSWSDREYEERHASACNKGTLCKGVSRELRGHTRFAIKSASMGPQKPSDQTPRVSNSALIDVCVGSYPFVAPASVNYIRGSSSVEELSSSSCRRPPWAQLCLFPSRDTIPQNRR